MKMCFIYVRWDPLLISWLISHLTTVVSTICLVVNYPIKPTHFHLSFTVFIHGLAVNFRQGQEAAPENALVICRCAALVRQVNFRERCWLQ